MDRRGFLRGVVRVGGLVAAPGIVHAAHMMNIQGKTFITTEDGWFVDKKGSIGVRGENPPYKTVLEFHRWLQELSGKFPTDDGTLDITWESPSMRYTDKEIVLNSNMAITDSAIEYLNDGILRHGDAMYASACIIPNDEIQHTVMSIVQPMEIPQTVVIKK